MKTMLPIPGLIVLLALALTIGCTGVSPGPQETSAPSPSPAVKVAGPAGPGQQSWEKEWEKRLSVARGEGRVMVYTSLGAQTRADLARAFKDKFGTDVEFVSGTTADLVAKLVRERQVNLYLADAIIAGAGATIPMKPYGFLDNLDAALVLPEVTDPKVWRGGTVPIIDKDRQVMVFISTFIRYIVRNADLIKEGEITSYADLLKPQYKGKIVLQDPTMPGNAQTFVTTLAVLWGQEKAREFLQALARHEPFITRDLRLQVEWVARGKYPLAIAPRIETVADFAQEGAPLAAVKVAEGGHVTGGGGGLAIVKNRPHPGATVLFVNWLLGREGQSVFIKGFGNPSARVDVPWPGPQSVLSADPGEKVVLQDEQFVLLQNEMGKVAREIFQASK